LSQKTVQVSINMHNYIWSRAFQSQGVASFPGLHAQLSSHAVRKVGRSKWQKLGVKAWNEANKGWVTCTYNCDQDHNPAVNKLAATTAE